MRVIDALWEKRNLGLTTQEITIETQDSIDDAMKVLETLKAEYQVVKVPTGSVRMMWALEEMGFHYIETTVHVTYRLSRLSIPAQYRRINNVVNYELMNQDDINQMFEKIQEGMFYTDRVALDPFFSPEQVSKRYAGWIHDELEKGVSVYKYIYKDSSIGFFTLKRTSEKEYYPFLAGLYREYQNTPLGSVYLYKPLVEARRLGGEKVSTHISLNNSNAVRMHVDYGFTFQESHCVFVKHEVRHADR